MTLEPTWMGEWIRHVRPVRVREGQRKEAIGPTIDMEERETGHDDWLWLSGLVLQSPSLFYSRLQDVGDKVCMGKHHAFRCSCRTARIDQECEIFLGCEFGFAVS